jgi:CHAT domain-containing protein/tetratricopeptide (TPR) repeat protein
MKRRLGRAFPILGILVVACGGAGGGDPGPGSGADSVEPGGGTARGRSYDALFAEADEVYFSGQYDSAAVLFARIYDNAVREGALPVQARALTWIGLARYRTGGFAEARRLGERALSLKLEHRLVDQYARSYNALGLLAWRENRLSESERLLRRAIEAAQEVGDRRLAANAAGNLALPQTELGRFAEARSALLTHQAVMSDLGETRAEGNAFTNLGMLEIRLGNPNGAIPLLREALALYRSIDYATGTQAALGQLGTAYTALGDSRRAFSVLDSALSIATEQGLEHEQVSIIEAMAELYRGAGDFRRALAVYDSAMVINARLGADIETAVDLRGKADILFRLGDVDRAHGTAEEALAIHRRAGAPLEIMLDLLILAELDNHLGRDEAVRQRLREASEIAASLGARSARVEVGLTEARIASRQRRSDDVLSAISRIEPDLADGGYAPEWEARLLESRALERLGRIREAAQAGRRALATVERVRRNFGSGTLRTAFVSDKREVYAHLISVLLRLGDVEAAFAVADAARGRVLLEQLAAAGRRVSEHAATRAYSQGEMLLAEIDRLVESIDYAESTPPDELDDAQRRELESLYDRLARARDAYEGLLVRLAETDPEQAALLGGIDMDIDAVRAALSDGELLVEYFVPPDGAVLVFAATKRDLIVLESAVSSRNLESRVRLVREMIVRNDGPEDALDHLLTSLHDALIRPLQRAGILSGVQDLAVVPHHALAYLPFAALKDGTTQRHLAEDYTLRLFPSAVALPALAERDAGPNPGVVAFAPYPDRLPATRLELAAVASGRRAVRSRTGAAATESALRRALSEAGVVHVATHGVLNAQNPMFSRLELARQENGPSANDGRLEVHELLDLEIAAGLVFLSGCETGAGAAHSTAFLEGEDYMTLAQAFLRAGANAVIATLWPVEDAGAAAFADVFYRQLDAVGPAEALARAQRALLADPRYGSPYHWAAFQLAGRMPADPGARTDEDIRATR